MKEIKIVASIDKDVFTKEVNKLTEDGWELYGEIFMHSVHDRWIEYSQALKREQSND